jgi:hypothetical protein
MTLRRRGLLRLYSTSLRSAPITVRSFVCQSYLFGNYRLFLRLAIVDITAAAAR